MTQLHEALIETRALIACGWTQVVAARDAFGCSVDSRDPDACSFCVIGAIDRVTGDDVSLRNWVRDAIRKHVTGVFISEFNDTPGRTKDEVLAVLDKAIEETKP